VGIESPGIFRIGTAPCPHLFVAEGAEVSVPVRRGYGNRGEAAVRLVTRDGTARAGVDYQAVDTTLTFAHGEVVKWVPVATRADSQPELTESLILDLSDPTGGTRVDLPCLEAGPILAWHGRLWIRDPEPPNDDFTSPPVLVLTPPLTRTRGALAIPAGDRVDIIAFDNPFPNARVWALADPGLPAFFSRDPVLRLHTAGGSLIEEDDDDGTTTGFVGLAEYDLAAAVVGRQMPGAGRFNLAVSVLDYAAGVSKCETATPPPVDAIDPYDLYVAVTTEDPVPESEPNNSIQNANPLVTLAAPVGLRSGTLPESDPDLYSVEASRGDLLFVAVDRNPTRGVALSDRTRVEASILGVAGDAIFTSLNSTFGCDPAPGVAFVYPVPASARYYLRLRHPVAEPQVGRYDLLVIRQSPQNDLRIADVTVTGGPGVGEPIAFDGRLVGVRPDARLRLRVNWGDGSAIESLDLAPGADRFRVTHTYTRPLIGCRVEFLANDEQNGGSSRLTRTIRVCQPSPAGLIAWWPGDGDAEDVTGGYDGTPVGGATFGAGKVDGAFQLNGLDGFIRVGNVAALNPGTGSFTVEAWFQKTQAGASDGYRIVSKGLSKASEPEWVGYAIHAYYQHLAFTVSDGVRLSRPWGPDTGVTAETQTPPADGVWHHVAGVLDRAEGKIRLFLDGVLAAESSFGSPGSLGSLDTEISFALGAQDTAPRTEISGRPPAHFLPGPVDEAAYWSRPLSGEEIAAIYQAGAAGRCKPRAIVSDTPVPLAIQYQGAGIQIVWPETQSPSVLDSAPSLADPIQWAPVSETPTTANGLRRVVLAGSGQTRYFRLRVGD
jgi:hypothetical protein